MDAGAEDQGCAVSVGGAVIGAAMGAEYPYPWNPPDDGGGGGGTAGAGAMGFPLEYARFECDSKDSLTWSIVGGGAELCANVSISEVDK